MIKEDNILAKPQEEEKKEASPIITRAGETFWFEGEPTFHTIVEQLQAEGKLAPSPYKLPSSYLSISQVEQYLRCPKQYEFRYIKGQKRPPSVALVQGTTIHATVEHAYKHVIEKNYEELPTLEMALDTYSGSLDKNLTDDVVWDDDEDEIAGSKDKGKVKDQGVELIKTWHKKKLPKVRPTAVEKSFVTSFAGIPVVGKVDLIDDFTSTDNPHLGPVVVDNKVVGKKYTQSAVDSKMQLSVYAHATKLPRQRYDLFIKTKTARLEEMLTSRDDRQIRWAVQLFESVAKAISAGIFPECSPENYLCSERFCGYWSICRGAI